MREQQVLGVALRRLREDRGLSQEAVAQRAGISLNTYSRIERGTVAPAWLSVTKIAKALDIGLAELGAAIDERRSN